MPSVLEGLRDKMHQGFVFPVGSTFADFVAQLRVLGPHAENYQADLNTDAAAMLIQSWQKPNGEWPYARADIRPPICSDYMRRPPLPCEPLQLLRTQRRSRPSATNRFTSPLPGWPRAQSFHNEDRCWRLTVTQQHDGTWYTKTRALGFQPYFDGSFPHGYDQWISGRGYQLGRDVRFTPCCRKRNLKRVPMMM